MNFYSWASKLSFQFNTLKSQAKYRSCNYSPSCALLSSCVFCFEPAVLRALWPLKDSSELSRYVCSVSGHTCGDPINCKIQMWRTELKRFSSATAEVPQHLPDCSKTGISWLTVAGFRAAVKLVVRVIYGRKAIPSHCFANREHG